MKNIISSPASNATLDLRISNVLTESVSLYPFIKNVGERLQLSQELVSSIAIALEEQLINVIKYSYPRGEEGVITLKARWRKATGILKFTLIDKGVPYNPTQSGESHHDRPLGALGINMISQLMDTVDYVRRAGYNILNFSKRISMSFNINEH